MEDMKTTTNRKLEGYLYALGIKPVSYEVLWDGMVQWTYRNTKAFEEACEQYKQTKKRLFIEKSS